MPLAFSWENEARAPAGVLVWITKAVWIGARRGGAPALRVVRAGPDGEKALFVSNTQLVSWPTTYGPQIWMGLRFGAASMEQVEVLFVTALRSAEEGASEEALRAWLRSLDARDVEALQVLREVATVRQPRLR